MDFGKIARKKNILINLGIIIGLLIILPLILNLIEYNFKVLVITTIGNYVVFILIIILILDTGYLLFKRQNNYLFSLINMYLTLLLFSLMMYSFLNNIYEIVYVMNYSNSTLPLIYKIVAIWAGEEGSIMTWMVFNSIIINFYRKKNQNKEDVVFTRSIIFSLLISITFLIILFSLNPFKVDSPPVFPNGRGLNPLLISPFMIWHPFFTFIAYAIFLVPFTIVIAEIITRKKKLLGVYQLNFYNFSLKFGWLVLTLGIGLGAYWAKIALTPWGRYWGWDPVETVSLVPWFFITAFFHTVIFKNKNPKLIKINVGLIFSSIVFSTLITRGGGLNSLHAFAEGVELVLWVVILGLIIILSLLYVIFIVIDYLMEEYRNKKLLFDYLSYLFLYGLAFVCIFGLFISPFTYLLSTFLPIENISIDVDYFIITTLTLSTGLALSLTFCSLWEYFDIKSIATYILVAFLIQLAFSYTLLFTTNIWINPILIIYLISLVSSIYKLSKNFTLKKGYKYFFRLNSKTIIHSGISFIFAGFLIISTYQDFFFIPGFILLLIGIIPSIFSTFFLKKER
ncbi:MAG: cytochrome c biogenesis protein CcsA [Candidatus Thorarchaeota archaeon]